MRLLNVNRLLKLLLLLDRRLKLLYILYWLHRLCRLNILYRLYRLSFCILGWLLNSTPEIILLLRLWLRSYIPKIILLRDRLCVLLLLSIRERWDKSKILLICLFILAEINIKVSPHLILILSLLWPSKLIVLRRLCSLIKHFKRVLLLRSTLNLLLLRLLKLFWTICFLFGDLLNWLFIRILYFLFYSL